MRNIIKNKRGISELVSYVLLIVLAIAIAGGVYVWLTSIAKPSQQVECPDVNIRLESYECFKPYNENPGNITLLLKNTGKFDITGFKMMVKENDPDGIYSNISVYNDCFKSYVLGAYGCEINVSNSTSVFGTFPTQGVKLVQIMPIKEVDKKLAYCKPINFIIDSCKSPGQQSAQS